MTKDPKGPKNQKVLEASLKASCVQQEKMAGTPDAFPATSFFVIQISEWPNRGESVIMSDTEISLEYKYTHSGVQR